jgi:hopanoid-associated phosphorylase
MKVAAVTGLEAEAKLIRRAGIEAAPSGGVATRTVALAQSYLASSADALLSFGIAGALAPALPSGTLLLPRAVIDESGARLLVDAAWRLRVETVLAAAGLAIEARDLLGAYRAVATAEKKAALFHTTGAVAVDLESHLIARAATEARRPFLILRAIADPATRSLPSAAVNGLKDDGTAALGRVIVSVLRHPGQIAALLRLAGDTRRALSALGSALEAKPFAASADEGSAP